MMGTRHDNIAEHMAIVHRYNAVNCHVAIGSILILLDAGEKLELNIDI